MKTYLGNGIYAEWKTIAITVTTETEGTNSPETNIIYKHGIELTTEDKDGSRINTIRLDNTTLQTLNSVNEQIEADMKNERANMVSDYCIVHAENFLELENLVRKKIKEGWLPPGGLQILEKNYETVFLQPLIK